MSDFRTLQLGGDHDAAIARLERDGGFELSRNGMRICLPEAEQRALTKMLRDFDPARCASRCSFIGQAARCELTGGHELSHRCGSYEWSEVQADSCAETLGRYQCVKRAGHAPPCDFEPARRRCPSVQPGTGLAGPTCELEVGHAGEHRNDGRFWIGNGPGVLLPGTFVATVAPPRPSPIEGIDQAEQELELAVAWLAERSTDELYSATERLVVELSEGILNAKLAYTAMRSKTRALAEHRCPKPLIHQADGAGEPK